MPAVESIPTRNVRHLRHGAWKRAITMAVNRRDPKSGEKYLDVIARKVVTLAVEGHMGAIDEIANRLDGPTRNIIVENLATIEQQVTRIESVVVDPDPNFLRDITADVVVEQQREDAADPGSESVPSARGAPQV